MKFNMKDIEELLEAYEWLRNEVKFNALTANQWLFTKNPYLGEAMPIQLFELGEGWKVFKLINSYLNEGTRKL